VQRDEVPALSPLPDARLGDQRGIARERGTRDPAEALVERDVDAVEQPRDLAVRPPVVGLRLPEAGSVEVHRDVPLPGPSDLGDEVVPGRQEATDLPLRQL
jgi:hypothetical protein